MFTKWYHENRERSERWLRELHQHPEIAFAETQTANFVATKLRSFGFEVETEVGGTGVVGTLHGQNISDPNATRCIGFRAELDALPMVEKSAVSYVSNIPDRFHGCGHDGHMVTALTAAAYLSEHSDFSGTVRFIFQPAEETLSGARMMLRDGLFTKFPCDELYALHNIPGIQKGCVAIPSGAALSSADDIDIKIHAKGTHGSMPHTGQDAIAAASHLISTIQQIATRVIDARNTGVISFGTIQGGTARNILPDTLEMSGTMRTTDQSTRDRLAQLINDTAQSTAALFGVDIEAKIESVAPETMNHPTCVDAVFQSASAVVGPDQVIQNARNIMASEDFSEFAALIPAAYFFVGQDGQMPHHPEYAFDPDIIPIGAAIFADLARTRTSLSNTLSSMGGKDDEL